MLPPPSGARPATDNIATEVKPTTLPTKTLFETDTHPQHKNNTDPSSNVVTLHPHGNDGSGLGTPAMKDKAVPSQALCPLSVDGVQETVTELPGPYVMSAKNNSTVSNPEAAPQGTGLSPLEKPEIHSSLSNPGPEDNSHSTPRDKEQISNVGSQSLASVNQIASTGLTEEPESQAMTRDTSMSSFLATERSNSVAEDSHLKLLTAHAASLERTKQTTAGIDPEQLRSRLEAQADATTSETRDTAKSHVKGSQHAIDRNVKTGKSKDEVSKKPSIPATPPKPQSSAHTPTSSRSPDRKQAPDIPQQTSSLLVSSTPIHTRLKKKPKTFSPVTEEAPGGATTPIDPAEGPSVR